MSFRWDKLLPTKNTLIRFRDPTTDDALNYDHGVIWVHKTDNKAWLLRDGIVTLLPPTSGMAVDITDGADYSDLQTAMTELESQFSNLEQEIDDLNLDNIITSVPASGGYQIKQLDLDADKKIVVTHDDTAEP